jgi:hypothetical protein
MDEGPQYWDPTPVVGSSVGVLVTDPQSSKPFELPKPESYLLGRWEERDWRNLPGPFCGGGTDTCWVGRNIAPAHVLYDDDYGQEFVYRQPRTATQVHQVLFAAWNDPFCGYACDGDERWSVETVRAWWRERRRLQEWIDQVITKWTSSARADEREAVVGLHDFAAYLDGALSLHLRGYLFWLDQRRIPAAGQALPEL